jgi:TfoX/Sxy family transcriptional regulator of competence genes
MAFDEFLADRIQHSLKRNHITFEAKRMMGGLCYLVDNKMCLGVIKNKLMARIDPDKYFHALTLKGCHEMDFTGRPMAGYVFVEPEGIDMDDELDYWVKLALEYNPKAKSSKKKK